MTHWIWRDRVAVREYSRRPRFLVETRRNERWQLVEFTDSLAVAVAAFMECVAEDD